MRIAFTGRKGLGGVKMRGVSVAKRLGLPFIDVAELPSAGRFDVLVLVKYWDDPQAIRHQCDRLIYDPLDPWSTWKKVRDHEGKLHNTREMQPADFWRWTHDQLGYDEIVATSPACLETMTAGLLDRKVIGHLAPHHADPRVGPGWHDPQGPVVYAGGLRFIESALPAIQKACDRIGRRFLVDYNKDCWERLKGAALSLHLRLPPEDYLLNRWCKPGVKVSNAGAAGLPLLATPDPCVILLQHGGITYHYRDNPDWQNNIAAALDSPPVIHPVTLTMHTERMAEIIGM